MEESFMFNMEDHEFIMKVIQSRDHNAFIMPLYVRVYNTTYSMMELDSMTEYNPASFKVGFGTSYGLTDEHINFPKKVMIDLDVINMFHDVDPDTGDTTHYCIFEISNNEVITGDLLLGKEIKMYVDALNHKCSDIVKRYKASLMDSNF